MADAAARLACYDALPLAAAAVTGRAAPMPSPALAVAPTAAADPVASFGLPALPAQVQEITSSIRGHFEGWSPGTRITLANGQVWEVLDTTQAYYDLDNPKVTVRHGALGSFVLDIEGARRSPHVRRIL